MKLTLPFPPSMNHYWRRHGHVIYVSAAGKKFQKDVQAAVVGLVQEPLTLRLRVSIVAHAPTKRRIDLDNRLKPALDAMTKAGVWVDDEQIDDLRIVRGEIVKGGRIEVTVEEF